MAYCVTCGIDVQSTDRFCRSCGTRQRAVEPAVDVHDAPASVTPLDLNRYDLPTRPTRPTRMPSPSPSPVKTLTVPTEAQQKRYARRVRWSSWVALAPAGVLLLLGFVEAEYANLALLWLVVVGGFLWFMVWVYDDRLPEPQRSRRIYTVGAVSTIAAVGLHQHRHHHAEQVRERRAQDDMHYLAEAARHHHGQGHHLRRW